MYSITIANNFLGHGFYQFSPELYFRIFTPNNGFRIERLIIFELSPQPKWYEVTDPEKAGKRINLMTQYPTYLLVVAQKKDSVPIFSSMPQQSDYTTLWKTGKRLKIEEHKTPAQKVFMAFKRVVPTPLKKVYRTLHPQSPFDPNYFKEVQL